MQTAPSNQIIVTLRSKTNSNPSIFPRDRFLLRSENNSNGVFTDISNFEIMQEFSLGNISKWSSIDNRFFVYIDLVFTFLPSQENHIMESKVKTELLTDIRKFYKGEISHAG